jgi:hypothetical protein
MGSPGEHRTTTAGNGLAASRIPERNKAPESSPEHGPTAGGQAHAVTRVALLGREKLWRAGIGEDVRR